MAPTEDDIRIFNDSLDRCISDPRFMDVFYDKFIGGSEDVAARFAGVDMVRQKRALKASLYTAMLAADGNQPAIEHLLSLSRSPRAMHIAAELYDLWLGCLIEAAQDCGALPDTRAVNAWRSVLKIAIEIMKGERESPRQ